MLNFTLDKTKTMYAAIHMCTDIASAKYKTSHSIQHYCALPKVMKIVPTSNIYLIVQNVLSFPSPPPKYGYLRRLLFGVGCFIFYTEKPVLSLPCRRFLTGGKSQAEQLNSYNSPVPILYQEKGTNPTFL